MKTEKIVINIPQDRTTEQRTVGDSIIITFKDVPKRKTIYDLAKEIDIPPCFKAILNTAVIEISFPDAHTDNMAKIFREVDKFYVKYPMCQIYPRAKGIEIHCERIPR